MAAVDDEASATEDGAVVEVCDEASATEDDGRDADGEEEVDDDEVWAVVDDEASATADDGIATADDEASATEDEAVVAVDDEASATEDGAVVEVGDDASATEDCGDGSDGESWVDDETTARVEEGSETEEAGRKKKPSPAMPTQSTGITATEMSATRRRTALLATVPDTAAQPSVNSVGVGMPSYASLKACCHLSV